MKSQIIVLDSPDCTGKTTTAKLLSTKLEIPIAPFFTSQQPLPPEKHRIWAEAGYNFLIDFVSFYPNNLILDRWAMTEFCYAPVKRGYFFHGYWDLEKKILDSGINFLWVYLHCNADILHDRYVAMKESSISFEDLLKVKGNYGNLFIGSNIRRIGIDTGLTSPEHTVENILRQL